MRIISGNLKNHGFEAPKGHRTHPMSEKARGAIFNALGDIEGLSLLDAFAGSGAVGFEAISRGAKSATLIDSSKEAINAINKSISLLATNEKVKATHANVSTWSDLNQDKQFDIVVADPPYNDIKEAILNKLTIHLSLKGIFVLSLPPRTHVSLNGLALLKENDYGDCTLKFYKKMPMLA